MIKLIKGKQMAIVWTIVRIWLGFQWIEAGFLKIKHGFDAGGFIQGSIDSPSVQGWYATFLETVALPNIDLFNVLVPWGEFLVGLGLIVGLATIPALIAGAFMNVNFIMAGVGLNSPDTKLFVVAMILLFVGAGSRYYGLDRFASHYLKAIGTKNDVAKVDVSA